MEKHGKNFSLKDGLMTGFLLAFAAWGTAKVIEDIHRFEGVYNPFNSLDSTLSAAELRPYRIPGSTRTMGRDGRIYEMTKDKDGQDVWFVLSPGGQERYRDLEKIITFKDDGTAQVARPDINQVITYSSNGTSVNYSSGRR